MSSATVQAGFGKGARLLHLNGIPSLAADGAQADCLWQDPEGTWRPVRGDGLLEIEPVCVALHQDLAARIFGGIERYHALRPIVPLILDQAGLNSEAAIGRDDFEQLLTQIADFPELNRFLYLYDCRILVSAIQECTIEVCRLTGEFYRILNLALLWEKFA